MSTITPINPIIDPADLVWLGQSTPPASGLRIERPKAINLETALSMALGFAPPSIQEADEEAVQGALGTLGIEVPVVVKPFLWNPYTPFPHGVPFDGLTYPVRNSHFEVLVNADRPDTPREDGAYFSFILWHELGHVQQVSNFARERSLPINLASLKLNDLNGNPAVNLWSGTPEGLDAYRASETERYADSIAERYAIDHPLTTNRNGDN